MSQPVDIKSFQFDSNLTQGIEGKRILITGSGKHQGLGQAFALACGLNKAKYVGVHFNGSYEDGLETVDLINQHGGNAFPVQADVTNTAEVWGIRSYVIKKMGGLPPNLLICNSGITERGYILGRAPKAIDQETNAMRRSRTRKSFIKNLKESTQVINTKIDGYLYMTHLWAGEALHFNDPLQVVYISSRQAFDPGAGVPGYVLANHGVLPLPKLLRTNLKKQGDLIKAFSVTYPFVHTQMTQEYATNEKVFGRWQTRMLKTNEAALALLQLLSRPAEELDEKIFQLNAQNENNHLKLTWSQLYVTPEVKDLPWSEESPLSFDH